MIDLSDYFTQQDDILKNKLGITSPEKMKKLEAEVVPLRMAEILANPPRGKMDFAYLKQIHFSLFHDLYYIAGQVRTVDIAKGDSVFCYSQNIESQQVQIFNHFNSNPQPGDLTAEALSRQLSWLSSELNALHPFREGNGRAIRTFLILFSLRCGFHIDYSQIAQASLLEADIRAFQGDLSSLNHLYYDHLTPID